MKIYSCYQDFFVCTKSSGVALGLANAWTLGHAKFVNAPPPALKRHTNTPQLPREWMGAPEIDWCITTEPRDLGRQWKIKDFTTIGCQQIHKNVISCIPIRNITSIIYSQKLTNFKVRHYSSKQKISIKKFYSDIELRHRNYGSDWRENQLILAPAGKVVWNFCISKCLISHMKRIQIFFSAKPEGFQNKLLWYLAAKKLHQCLRQHKKKYFY